MRLPDTIVTGSSLVKRHGRSKLTNVQMRSKSNSVTTSIEPN